MTSTYHSKHELSSVIFCNSALGSYIRLWVWTFLKTLFSPTLMCTFESSVRVKLITLSWIIWHSATVLNRVFLFGSRMNIQLPVTTQWTQAANQKQDLSISCNPREKCKIKHDGVKSTPNWCPRASTYTARNTYFKIFTFLTAILGE